MRRGLSGSVRQDGRERHRFGWETELGGKSGGEETRLEEYVRDYERQGKSEKEEGDGDPTRD